MSILDNENIDFECPSCKAQVSVTFKDAREGRTVSCGCCNSSIKLEPDESVQQADQAIEDAIKRLQDSLQDISIKIKF